MFIFSSQNDRITPVDVYERLWKCRDFEISHLWQRSVYLGTLLVLVAGGYGKLFECYVDVKGICIGPLPPCFGNLPFVHRHGGFDLVGLHGKSIQGLAGEIRKRN